MNPKRYEAVLNGLTSVAKKVLDAVSEKHAMTSTQVYHELVKKGTPVKNFRIIEGCLSSLTNSKLLSEYDTGLWIRLPAPAANDNSQQPVTETDSDVSTVVDHSEVFASVEPSSELEVRWKHYFPDQPMPEPAEAAVLLDYVPAGDEAFTVETMDTPPERNPHYEAYLLARNERTVDILRMLSEQVDDEIGLALLEIAEELDESSNLMLEYFLTVSEHIKHRIVLNPGYFQHDLPNGVVVYNRAEKVPPEVMAAYIERFAADSSEMEIGKSYITTEQAKNAFRENGFLEAILQEYESKDSNRHEYLNGLLAKLKEEVTVVESPMEEIRLPEEPRPPAKEIIEERKARRDRCDVKVNGISQAPEYRAWSHLVSNSKRIGMEVEPRWTNSLSAMIDDVGYQPAPNARLVRIDRQVGWMNGNVEWRLEGHTLPGRTTPPRNWPKR